MSKIKKNDWIEISDTLLTPENRASGLPEDTSFLSYKLRVRGFAQSDGNIGEKITIKTVTGRVVIGEAEKINPYYDHDFGDCIPELIKVRTDLKELIKKK